MQSQGVGKHCMFVDIDTDQPRIKITSSGNPLPHFVHHGTDRIGFKGICSDRRMLASGSPSAVYCTLSLEDVVDSGYNGGFVFQAKPVAMLASKATSRILDVVLPGVAVTKDRCAKSEVLFHTESLQVVSCMAPATYLGSLVREALDPTTRSKESLHMHKDKSAVTHCAHSTPSQMYSLRTEQQSDQTTILLEYLTERLPPNRKNVVSRQGAGNAEPVGLPLTRMPLEPEALLQERSFLDSIFPLPRASPRGSQH